MLSYSEVIHVGNIPFQEQYDKFFQYNRWDTILSKILLHIIQDIRDASFHLTLTKDMKYDFTCSEDQIFSGILLYTFLDVLLLRICFLLQTYSFQLCMKSTFLISYLFNEVCPKNFHTMILPYLFPPDRPWLALLT